MVNAIILMNCEGPQINQIAEKLTGFDEISEVYSVAGRYDLVAIIRVQKNEQLANIVTSELTNIDGIISTETLTAFRVYSRHDLEHMFSIGLD